MKKYYLCAVYIFFVAVQALTQSNIIISPKEIKLNGSSKNLNIREFELLNLDTIPYKMTVDFDTSVISLSPIDFTLQPQRLKKILVFILAPQDSNTSANTKIRLLNDMGQIIDSINVLFTGNPAVKTVPEETTLVDIPETGFIPEFPLPEPENIDLQSKIDTLENKVADLSDRLVEKDLTISTLRDEVRHKDLELVTLTQQANRDLEELKLVQLPEFVPDGPASADEYLNTLFQRLNDDLGEEIKNNEVVLSWRDNDICITLAGKISFITGSVYMKLRGETILKKICDLLKQYPNQKMKIMVMGHTDAQPYKNDADDGFSNWELSSLRATKVVRCLMRLGAFDGKNLYSVGNSAYHPIADNNTYQGRVENRRIELLISMVD